MVRRDLPIWKIKDIVEIMNKCQEQEFDMILFIEGNRGTGKSTLGWHLARRCHSPFNPKEDLCYSRKAVINQLARKHKGVIFADEMINVGFKRDFYETDQKVLIKGLNMYRDSFNIFIGCIPNFQNLDSQLKDLCKIRITTIRRGLALVHRPLQSQFMTDKWDSRNNQKIEMKWSISKKRKPKYSQLTTSIAYLHFPDISEIDKKLYLQLKHEKRNRVYGSENMLDEDLKLKGFYDNLLNEIKKGFLSKKELVFAGKMNGKTWNQIRDSLNHRLRKEGNPNTLTDYLTKKKKVKEKEKVKHDWSI